jgi:ketosteroid isomerase-like protein
MILRNREGFELLLHLSLNRWELPVSHDHDNVGIARRAYAAYATKDRSALEALLADDFRFTSPLDNGLNRETYFARCWPAAQNIEAFDFIHLMPAGDRVFVTYEGRRINGDGFRNTEILTMRRGKVVDVEVYFGWSIPHKAVPGSYVGSDA